MFRGFGTLNHVFHVIASAELIRQRWRSGEFDDLDGVILEEIYFEEVVILLWARSSAVSLTLTDCRVR